MQSTEHILGTFERIGLSDMDAVKLMDRSERKFALPAHRLPVLLELLRPNYRLLSAGERTMSSYKTLYFDTHNRDMYARHHSGHASRYKVRHRQYVESNSGFLEVKFRNNKGRTLKSRIGMAEPPLYWNAAALNFLNSHTPYDAILLEPVLWVSYKRITLVGNSLNERLTIDMDIEFASGPEKQLLDNLVILELKQAIRGQSPAPAILHGLHIREGALSKYCLGMVQLYPKAKKNNFKEKLTALNKLVHDTPLSAAAGR